VKPKKAKSVSGRKPKLGKRQPRKNMTNNNSNEKSKGTQQMTNDNNNKLKSAGIITTFVLIFASLVASWTTAQNTQKFTVSTIEGLKKDGTYLARANEKDIISIKSDIKYIKESVSRIEKAVIEK